MSVSGAVGPDQSTDALYIVVVRYGNKSAGLPAAWTNHQKVGERDEAARGFDEHSLQLRPLHSPAPAAKDREMTEGSCMAFLRLVLSEKDRIVPSMEA